MSQSQYDSIMEMARAEVQRVGDETGGYPCGYTPKGCTYDGFLHGTLRYILLLSET